MHLHTELSRHLAAALVRERITRPPSAGAERSPRRRALRLLAMVTVLAALALPARVDAATYTVVGSQLQITGGNGSNSVSVSQFSDGRIVVSDSREANQIGPGCTTGQAGVLCSGANRIAVALGGDSDVLSSTVSLPTQYFGGAGDDALVTGTGFGASKVSFTGGAGRDTANYAAATRAVSVTKDGAADDGRAGDADNIDDDVEVLQGSRFADTLRGDTTGELPGVLHGLGGDDLLIGGAGNDIFPTAPGDGADRIDGFTGFDTVDYRTRTSSVTITVDAGGSDDGEGGERDDVRNMEQVLTGPGDDTIIGSPFATGDNSFVSSAGRDRITGTDRNDLITPGAGRDTVDARGGSDLVRARDGEADTIACGGGTGIDLLQADAGLDSPTTGCETVESVGVLRLSPVSAAASRGVTRVSLSWRHPRAWHRLRSITLGLRDGASPVGAVVVTPRTAGLKARGAVELVGRASRLRRSGSRVRARLELRLDASLAGRRVALDVEAIDLLGRRQLEEGAGSIRVGSESAVGREGLEPKPWD